MSIAEAHGERDGVEGRDVQSPSPDLSNKSSKSNLSNIVIPSTEIYGSETPSPLSPITPPDRDRLSPIEELDDNASLRSINETAKAPFETSIAQESNKPRIRPESSDFDLQPIIETNDIPLETKSELLFSRQHLELIFADKELSTRFGTFLRTYRPDSVPILGYYLDTIKALRTLKYAEAVVKNLEHIPGLEFTADAKGVTMTWILEDKADRALDILTKNDLPAFIAYVYVCIVDLALVERVTGKVDMEGNDVAIGLAEVFTISDPSRPDNPLVFASEEFHRMTQYPSNQALGRNCRFLGGPKTDPNAIGRFKNSLVAEREHCEVMLNYRRDGSPFINLIMVVPLRDQNGKVRYYLGAQLDITELLQSCTGLDSLQKLIARQSAKSEQNAKADIEPCIDQLAEFQQLSETFSSQELQSLLKSQDRQQLDDQVNRGFGNSKGYPAQSVRVKNSSTNLDNSVQLQGFGSAPPLGFYKNYLLVRPHPSLRILFASPDLRVPGILQSPLMEQIGGSPRVRDDLYYALELGQKVTAKVQWLSKSFQDGHARWIHCTPLISANGSIGVWMVILVDDDEEPITAGQEPELEPLPTTMIGADEVSAATPWESTKEGPTQQIDSNGSPSTSTSSQTAFSESAKPTFEKVPSIVKEAPDVVSLPFLSSRLRGSDAGLPITDRAVVVDRASNDDLRRSTDSAPWSKAQQQSRLRNGQPPEVQSTSIRPGPRIAGRAYSFDSNSSHGISADDERNSVGSTSGNRPMSGVSQVSNMTTIQSNVQPPDLRWRKVEDQERLPSRGGPAPIKFAGRPSQEATRPLIWKTKKSLSPYGFLFNE